MSHSSILIAGKGTQAAQQISAMLTERKFSFSQIYLGEAVEFEKAAWQIAIVCLARPYLELALQLVQKLNELGIPTLVAAESRHTAEAETAVEHGVVDVLEMPVSESDLEDALDTVLYRREIERHQVAMVDHARNLATLSPRERRVVQLAADGAPNKQIASTVGLSVKSIERIRRDAYRKLNVRSTAEMTRVFLLGSMYQCGHFIPAPHGLGSPSANWSTK